MAKSTPDPMKKLAVQEKAVGRSCTVWPDNHLLDYPRFFKNAYRLAPTYHRESMLGAMAMALVHEQVPGVRLVACHHTLDPVSPDGGIPRGGDIHALAVGEHYLDTEGPRTLAELCEIARLRAQSWALPIEYTQSMRVIEDGEAWDDVGRVGEDVEAKILRVLRMEKARRAQEILDGATVKTRGRRKPVRL